uniref:Uncharacterized protein n=1 Tax=Naja naja TaxID=35670 RepID=A0A8C6XN77_NAJNA
MESDSEGEIEQLTGRGTGAPVAVEEMEEGSYILSTLPQLKNFDFSGVTKLDRSTAAVWRRMNIKPKVIRKKRERY